MALYTNGECRYSHFAGITLYTSAECDVVPFVRIAFCASGDNGSPLLCTKVMHVGLSILLVLLRPYVLNIALLILLALLC